jgi:ABC-type uncharacterized transport system YnjBCD ATPase subunit
MGTFFPATSIDGLSDHEKSSILELVDIFQLDNFTSQAEQLYYILDKFNLEMLVTMQYLVGILQADKSVFSILLVERFRFLLDKL